MARRKAAKLPAPDKHVYEGNDKHEKPWQRGRKGSLCEKETVAQAQELLDGSATAANLRFATDGARAFQGAEHRPYCWHGWPVGWKEVPEPLRREWIARGEVKRSDVRRFWDDHAGQG